MSVLLFALLQTAAVSVQGVVVKAESGEPQAKATVELRPEREQAGVMPPVTPTDVDGTFLFRGTPPGRYRVIATRPGYAQTEYGQHTPNGAGEVLVVGPGRGVNDVRLEMIRTASISGRIVDRSGQPKGNASVQALTATVSEGRRDLSVVRSVRANDLGEYRLFWLPPGEYYVSAAPVGGVQVSLVSMAAASRLMPPGRASQPTKTTEAGTGA